MATNKPFEFFVQWHLTENCNLWCRHCYQGERSSEEMHITEMKRVVGEVSDMIKDWSDTFGIAFSPSMNITGGEPFLKKDLFEILGEIKKRGFKVSLLTNGTLVSRDRAKKLADLGIDGVQISIEGPEDVHDAIRGSGNFSASRDGIEHLVDAKLPVTLNVTLSAVNASSMKKIVALGSHMGARRIGFSRLVPTGKGRSMLSQMLDREQVKETYQTIFALEHNGVEIVTGDPIASQMRKRRTGDAGSIAVSGCSAGVAGLTILPNGNITPCRRLPLSLGNVMKDSLREIWSTSPILDALRDRSRYKGKCRTCRHWAHCRGCRAISYAWARSRGVDDFLGEDPQCFIEA
jgi:radical SAM protein with 4Fe4S-binding SPASM domain